MRKILILITLVASAGAAWLTTRVDDGLGTGWTHVVVRNWDQFGLLNLHGKLIENPGGFEADTNPEYYPGHRAASLYPAFFCYKVAGAGHGFIAYYLVVAAMVLLSIWCLLGRTDRAFWLAVIAVLTPGYVRWQTSLDPNLAATMFGFPFCAVAIVLLRRPSLNWPRVMLLAGLIFFYSALNWSTVFVHAMLFVTLLILPGVPRKHLFLYVGVTAAIAGVVLVTSVAGKLAHAGPSAGMAAMLGSYSWSDSGYGLGMTTRTAFGRLLVVNLVGLLPVLAFFGWQWLHRGRSASASSSARLWFLLPALMAGVEVLGMRNYFGHHPWMSTSFLLLGIILAATVWKTQAALPAGGQIRLPVPLAWTVAVFAYSFMVLTVFNMHVGRELALAAFVREHTARTTTIVIRRDTDPELADLAPRLPELFDRHVLITPDAGQNQAPVAWEREVVLTCTNPPSEKPLAQTALVDPASPGFKQLIDWYGRHIAHRRAGDQMEIRGTNYFLYPVPK